MELWKLRLIGSKIRRKPAGIVLDPLTLDVSGLEVFIKASMDGNI